MITRRLPGIARAAAVAVGLGLAVTVRAADPAPAPDASKSRDTLKSQKYEVKAVPYRDEGRDDPFVAKVPLKAVQSRDRWKVRIGGLKLSSVMSGKKKVALFTESYGPSFSYILVNSVLIGPDHRPIPGIAGSIEPIGASGNYRVILQQGSERVEHTFIRLDEDVRRRANELRVRKDRERAPRQTVEDGGAGSPDRNQYGGGDR